MSGLALPLSDSAREASKAPSVNDHGQYFQHVTFFPLSLSPIVIFTSDPSFYSCLKRYISSPCFHTLDLILKLLFEYCLLPFYVGIQKHNVSQLVKLHISAYAVFLCLGYTPGFFTPLSIKKYLSLVRDKTKPSGSTCRFSMAHVTKKHKCFPGICEDTGGTTAAKSIPGLCFLSVYLVLNSLFLSSFLKSAAKAVLKLISAVMAIAHNLSVIC